MVEMIKLLSFLCYLSLSACRKAWQESNGLHASKHSTTLQNDVCGAVSVSVPKKRILNSDSVIKVAEFVPFLGDFSLANLMKEEQINKGHKGPVYF